MYEYQVGQYINTKIKQFPCFIETYGLFKYENTFNLNNLNELKKIEINWSDGCLNSDKLSILIQSVKYKGINSRGEDVIMMAKTIFGVISRWTPEQSDANLISILIQIYMPLSTLCNEFTHYDLNDLNVILYETNLNTYIEYNYHLQSGEIINFRSSYIAKIIDYGQAYFSYINGSTPQSIANIICTDPSCDINLGFHLSGIDSHIGKNIGADLLLINKLQDLPIIRERAGPLNPYTIDLNVDRRGKVLPPLDIENIWTIENNKIYNVNDLLKYLIYYFDQTKNYEYYNDKKLLGVMNVYHNQPFEFIGVLPL